MSVCDMAKFGYIRHLLKRYSLVISVNPTLFSATSGAPIVFVNHGFAAKSMFINNVLFM